MRKFFALALTVLMALGLFAQTYEYNIEGLVTSYGDNLFYGESEFTTSKEISHFYIDGVNTDKRHYYLAEDVFSLELVKDNTNHFHVELYQSGEYISGRFDIEFYVVYTDYTFSKGKALINVFASSIFKNQSFSPTWRVKHSKLMQDNGKYYMHPGLFTYAILNQSNDRWGISNPDGTNYVSDPVVNSYGVWYKSDGSDGEMPGLLVFEPFDSNFIGEARIDLFAKNSGEISSGYEVLELTVEIDNEPIFEESTNAIDFSFCAYASEIFWDVFSNLDTRLLYSKMPHNTFTVETSKHVTFNELHTYFGSNEELYVPQQLFATGTTMYFDDALYEPGTTPGFYLRINYLDGTYSNPALVRIHPSLSLLTEPVPELTVEQQIALEQEQNQSYTISKRFFVDPVARRYAFQVEEGFKAQSKESSAGIITTTADHMAVFNPNHSEWTGVTSETFRTVDGKNVTLEFVILNYGIKK